MQKNEYSEYNQTNITNNSLKYRNEFFEKNNIGNEKNPLKKRYEYKELNTTATTTKPTINAKLHSNVSNLKSKRKKKKDKLIQFFNKFAIILGATMIGAVIIIPNPFAIGQNSYLLSQDQIFLQIYAEANFASYFFEISNYKPKGKMLVRVTGNGAEITNEVYIEDYPDAPPNEPRDGTMICYQGIAEGLSPKTEYKFSIIDDGHVIWEQKFTTEAEKAISYLLSEDQISIQIFTGTDYAGYYFEITGYTHLGDMYVRVVDGNSDTIAEESVQTASATGQDQNSIYSRGSLQNLLPETEYTLYIIDDGHVIWEQKFTTEAANEPSYLLSEDQIFIQIYTEANFASYFFEIRDYAPIGEIFVHITGEGIDTTNEAYIDEYEDDLGNLQKMIYSDGSVERLSPETEYTLCIIDDGHIIWEQKFTTEAVSYLLSEDQISIQIFTGTDYAGYYFEITGYTHLGDMYVRFVDGNSDTIAQESVQTASAAGQDQNSIYSRGSLQNLSPETEYTLYIIDDGHVIWEQKFTTEPAN